MEARVKADYPYDTVQAHTGREYVRYEWRPVPDGDDKNDLLEYRTGAPKPEPKPAAKPRTKPRTRRKPKAAK
jgi:hypothetical protein